MAIKLFGKTFGISAVAALALTGGAWVGTALAHHSNAAFDREGQLDLTGTVVEFHLVNPHAFIYLDVVGENGAVQEWALQTGGNVGRLIRANWTADSMSPGDTIIATVSPSKDGATGGLLESVELEDGTILGAN